MNESSGSWSTTFETTYDVDCEELTNNGLYLIFIGYLLPLLSPKVRDYGTELLSKFRNAGKVAGDLVSLTELSNIFFRYFLCLRSILFILFLLLILF